jgi:hypothetical protein
MSNIDPLNTTNPRKRRLAKISKDEINHLRIATGMAGFVLDNPSAELILMVQAGMKKYGGDFDLYTACRITAHIVKKYSLKKKKK